MNCDCPQCEALDRLSERALLIWCGTLAFLAGAAAAVVRWAL
jgi:hypothetical protein